MRVQDEGANSAIPCQNPKLWYTMKHKALPILTVTPLSQK